MELEGRIWKSRKKGGPTWIVEVSALDIVTQGYSKEEALEMIRDAILELMRSAYRSARKKSFDIIVHDYEKNGLISVSCSDPKLLAAFSIKRQRLKTRTTLREAARRLGSSSPNAYARYEQGTVNMSFLMYDRLLQAVNPNQRGLFIK